MGLYRRRKHWYARWTDAGGRERRLSLSRDREAAQIKFARILKAEAMRDAGVPVADPLMADRQILQHVTDWKKALGRPDAAGRRKRACSPLYIEKAGAEIERAAELLAWDRLVAIDDAEVVRYAEDLAEGTGGGWANSTRNHRLGYWSAFCAWCVRTRRMERNPFEASRVPRWPDEGTMGERALGAHEFHRLVAYRCAPTKKTGLPGPRAEAWERRRTIWAVLGILAPRSDEAGRLLVRDARLEGLERHVIVRPEVAKTGVMRILPVPAPLVPMLRAQIERVGRALRDGEDVREARLLGPGAIPDYNQLQQDLERAGVDLEDEYKRRAGPHALRRSAGTRLTAAGYSDRLVEIYLGHADGRVTGRYIDRVRIEMRAAAEALAECLTRPVPESVPGGWHSVSRCGTTGEAVGPGIRVPAGAEAESKVPRRGFEGLGGLPGGLAGPRFAIGAGGGVPESVPADPADPFRYILDLLRRSEEGASCPACGQALEAVRS